MRTQSPTPRFPIGTKFIRRNTTRQDIETIINIINWIDAAGNCVGRRYVTQHEFMGKPVRDSDVLETTIARSKLIQD